MTSLGRTLAALKAVRSPSAEMRGDKRLKAVDRFGANPGELDMFVHAPKARRPKAGLVVVLHGCAQTAEDYAAPAGWLDLADRFGFVVVAPEQRRTNNPNLCFNWYQSGDARREGGEAASIAQMVAWAVRAYDLDAEKVFVTGLSAGGAMTSVMLATHPELFAGGAIVAGLPYGVAASLGEAFEAMSRGSPPPEADLGRTVRRATNHAGPWPVVSVWHGQSDALVRPAAGEAVAAQWRDVHSVTGPERTAITPDGRDFFVWTSPEGRPVVELHRIAGLGHGAPVKAGGVNGCGHASRYTPEIGISSSFEIALGWGLVEIGGEAARATHRAKITEETPPQPANRPDPVAAIIDDALRAAGLLR